MIEVANYYQIDLLTSMARMESEPIQAPQPSLSYINLNVGGTFYMTSLSTLKHYPDSMLAVMFNQEAIPLAKDETGRYIIDRDGATFRYVLNFLRGGNLNLPTTFCDYDQLKEEVDFYQLDDMKELLELRRVRLSDIHLNVGGTFYATSLSTLNHYPDSMLAVTFNQEDIPLAKDETGRYIIDRDGATFRYVLNFLRGGKLNLPPTFCYYDQLKDEVDFYQLGDMKELLEFWRIMNWKEAEQAVSDQSKRNLYHTQIGNVLVGFQAPGPSFIQNNQLYTGRFCPDLYGCTGNSVIAQRRLAAKPEFKDDLTSFRDRHNYFNGKGNYMPNSQEELKKLREAADLYDIPGLRNVLYHKTMFFPTTLKFTK